MKNKTSNLGLKDGWTRATFIVKKDMLKKIKHAAIENDKSIKDLLNDIFKNHFKK